MNEFDDRALVIRKGVFHEVDLWLKLLCRSQGLFTIFAFGGAKSKRRFCGCLDTFNSLDCRIKCSRNGEFYNLQEAVFLAGPQKLRHDWRGMGLASNCLRFVEALGVNAENAPECYDILENLRDTLEEHGGMPAVTAFFFRLRVATALGYKPQLAICGKCGRAISQTAVFKADEGQIFCDGCATDSVFGKYRYALPVKQRALSVLRHVQETMPGQWPALSLDNGDERACARIIDSFMQYHLGIVWENGYFRHV